LRVFVTGATGALGRHLVPGLVAAGHEVTATTELVRTRDGRQGLNYAIYHDRYRRTPDGWKFTERVYEVRYLDTSPLAGSAPPQRRAPADPAARRRGAIDKAAGRALHGDSAVPGEPFVQNFTSRGDARFAAREALSGTEGGTAPLPD